MGQSQPPTSEGGNSREKVWEVLVWLLAFRSSRKHSYWWWWCQRCFYWKILRYTRRGGRRGAHVRWITLEPGDQWSSEGLGEVRGNPGGSPPRGIGLDEAAWPGRGIPTLGRGFSGRDVPGRAPKWKEEGVHGSRSWQRHRFQRHRGLRMWVAMKGGGGASSISGWDGKGGAGLSGGGVGALGCPVWLSFHA